MSKPINDMQLYVLVWLAKDNGHGGFSELHYPPKFLEWNDGARRTIMHPERTAFDRPQLLGLGKRGLLCARGHGCWEITEAGRDELKRPKTIARIEAMIADTARRQADIDREIDEERAERKGST